MIDVKNCKHNPYWYDITDIAIGEKGMNTKICLNLECKYREKRCSKEITTKGYPFYDPNGEKANLV